MKKDINLLFDHNLNLNIQSIGYYLHLASWGLAKCANKEIKKVDLNLQLHDLTILQSLDIMKGCSQSQLAYVLGRERSSISRSMASLEKKGYIKREALNGSTNYVTITEKGEQIIPLINETMEKVYTKALKGITKKKQEITMQFLTQFFLNSVADDE